MFLTNSSIQVNPRCYKCGVTSYCPTGAAIDAAVVGKNVDGAVIVAAQNATSSRAIINTKRTLEDSGVKILGAVLNKCRFEESKYGHYYGNYYGNYYGRDEDEK